eukprot:617870-Rhodomonas_salina.1
MEWVLGLWTREGNSQRRGLQCAREGENERPHTTTATATQAYQHSTTPHNALATDAVATTDAFTSMLAGYSTVMVFVLCGDGLTS